MKLRYRFMIDWDAAPMGQVVENLSPAGPPLDNSNLDAESGDSERSMDQEWMHVPIGW